MTAQPRAVSLPPGQRQIDHFPRFGSHLSRPPPDVPAVPAIDIGGAVSSPFTMPLRDLATLPRKEITADFHCVAGWSVTGLRWEGVRFKAFYRAVVEPAIEPGSTITHVRVAGLDGVRAVLTLEDALADDVLIAECLNGRPLNGDHGAPARLVSPRQYGFISIKHLCRIEVHTSQPTGFPRDLAGRVAMTLLDPHPRARVWEEERHRRLPGRPLRLLYRSIGRRIIRRADD